MHVKHSMVDSLTVFTVNEVLHQRLGNILKQLNLSCFNTKYFFKGVLRLKDKQKSIAQVYDIQQRTDECHYYYYVLHLLVSRKVSGLCWVQLRQEMCIVQILMVLLLLLILLIDLVLSQYSYWYFSKKREKNLEQIKNLKCLTFFSHYATTLFFLTKHFSNLKCKRAKHVTLVTTGCVCINSNKVEPHFGPLLFHCLFWFFWAGVGRGGVCYQNR